MNCKLCGKETKLVIDDGEDFLFCDTRAGGDDASESFTVELCDVCGVAYTTPFISNEALSSYYLSTYSPYTPKKPLISFLKKIKYHSDLRLIRKHCARKNHSRLFEIGAGAGDFLSAAKSEGFSIFGAEPSAFGVQIALERNNIELEQKYDEEIEFQSKYDVIVMRQVIEHCNRFDETLRRIFADALNEDGVLYLKLPRFDSQGAEVFKKYWDNLELPRHRVHFTAAGIAGLLSAIGYTNIEITDEWIFTDSLHSVSNYQLYSHNELIIPRFYRVLLKVPRLARLVLVLLYPLFTRAHADRMIVVCRKPKRQHTLKS